MRYCVQCGSEYQDDVRECADCGATDLVTEEELHRRGKMRWNELDTRQFALAATAEDFLTSQRFVRVLEDAQIPVLPRARRVGTVDALTTPGGPWWEILVPEESVARASELIRQERANIDAEASEAIRAAEEEEAELEATPPPSRKGS